MRSIRALALAVAALLFGVVLATPAFANGHHHHPHYPPVFNGISASPHEVCTGHKVTFKAWTFKSNKSVTWTDKVSGTTVASGNTSSNNSGRVIQKIQMTLVGAHKVTFSGPGKNVNTLTLSITVTANRCHHHHHKTAPSTSSPAPSVVIGAGSDGSGGLGALLRTGAYVGSGLALLVAFGAGLLLLISGTRRRRQQQTT